MPIMTIHGKNILGSALSAIGKNTYQGFNPRAGTASESRFHDAGREEIDKAAELAGTAAEVLQKLSGSEIADFLEVMREEILGLGDLLIEKADEESALGLERLRGERDRTTNQIKLFASLVREGSWVDARIDTAQPERKPLPRPDLRRILQPIGPVAVFGASNFPLAFSVAGGDTVSALAARNPVIVKAHPAHPGTSELVATAIAKAVTRQSLPPGTFSLLHGVNPEVSLQVTMNPHVKAVAFTGSQRAGRALFDAAAKRPEPIPVFSEMGSANPVFLLPGALEKSGDGIAEGLYKSATLGIGQFCTKPGLVFAVRSPSFDQFVSALGKHFQQAVPGTMLNAAIAKSFSEDFQKTASVDGVKAQSSIHTADPQRTEGQPGLLVTDARTWLQNERLKREIFGPATVIVGCGSDGELVECAKHLEGSLTATVHGSAEELVGRSELLSVLRAKAGRLICNGYPTGVEVSHAMQHGGPYPASTDSRFTSVGTAAIYRFARPVCYQNFPQGALPLELRDENSRGIWRLIDGERTKDSVPARA